LKTPTKLLQRKQTNQSPLVCTNRKGTDE